MIGEQSMTTIDYCVATYTSHGFDVIDNIHMHFSGGMSRFISGNPSFSIQDVHNLQRIHTNDLLQYTLFLLITVIHPHYPFSSRVQRRNLRPLLFVVGRGKSVPNQRLIFVPWLLIRSRILIYVEIWTTIESLLHQHR